MIIDISHYQTIEDWKEVVKTVDTIFIKATEGATYVDPNALKSATSAKAAGIKISYYHFATLNTKDVVKDAKTEAQFFLSVVKKLPKNDIPLVLDIEDDKRAKSAGLKSADVLLWINTFFYELAQSGYTDYILYSYTPFLNTYLPKDHKLGTIPLWLAAYSSSYKTPVGWKKPWLWQYDDKGKVAGISGNVDLNKYI